MLGTSGLGRRISNELVDFFYFKQFYSGSGPHKKSAQLTAGPRAPARGRRAAERLGRRNRSAAPADCGGINKADSERSDKARCYSWTITNVRRSDSEAAVAAATQLVRYPVRVSPVSRYGAFRVAGPKQSGRRPGRPADG